MNTHSDDDIVHIAKAIPTPHLWFLSLIVLCQLPLSLKQLPPGELPPQDDKSQRIRANYSGKDCG